MAKAWNRQTRAAPRQGDSGWVWGYTRYTQQKYDFQAFSSRSRAGNDRSVSFLILSLSFRTFEAQGGREGREESGGS